MGKWSAGGGACASYSGVIKPIIPIFPRKLINHKKIMIVMYVKLRQFLLKRDFIRNMLAGVSRSVLYKILKNIRKVDQNIRGIFGPFVENWKFVHDLD